VTCRKSSKQEEDLIICGMNGMELSIGTSPQGPAGE
jgi:hypothetical protein